jgi:hypothetical protein
MENLGIKFGDFIISEGKLYTLVGMNENPVDLVKSGKVKPLEKPWKDKLSKIKLEKISDKDPMINSQEAIKLLEKQIKQRNPKHKMVLNPENKEMEELAKEVHVLRGKSFRIKVTSNTRSNLAHINWTKKYLENHTFMIGEELLVQGDYDGWSQWYGLDNRFDEFKNWVEEGRIALNIYQTKNTSIRPQWIEWLKKHNQWDK